ncbi:hypothetical protein MHYP_G00080450 [Metynnis hypsauchen]
MARKLEDSVKLVMMYADLAFQEVSVRIVAHMSLLYKASLHRKLRKPLRYVSLHWGYFDDFHEALPLCNLEGFSFPAV